MRKEHAGAGVSHHAPDLRAHLRLIAADGALRAHGFFRAEAAVLDATRRVIVEIDAFGAEAIGEGAIGEPVLGAAVYLDHDPDGAPLTVETVRCECRSVHVEFLSAG